MRQRSTSTASSDSILGSQPLKPLWDRRDLAIVHACGSPDSTRSHFDAQDYMETATPGVKSTSDGWLNRYLQARHAEAEIVVPRRRAHVTAAAHAAGLGAGAGDESDRAVRDSRRQHERLVRGPVSGGRRSRAEWNGTRSVRRDEDIARRRPDPISRRKTAPTTRAVRSGRR